MKIQGMTYIICFFVVIGLARLTSGQTEEQKRQLEQKKSVLEKALVSAGYAIKGKTDPVPSDWEKEQFHLRSKYRVQVKSTKPIPGERGLYFRFTVDIEAYLNEADAQKRLDRIKSTPPGVDSKMEPEYVLREGFQRGNLVYVVSTDVYKFVLDKHLTGFRKKLEAAISGDPATR